MLQNYNWEKDTIEGFKSILSQYRMFEDGKWEDYDEDNFMSSYGSWAFIESVRTFNLCYKDVVLKCRRQ